MRAMAERIGSGVVTLKFDFMHHSCLCMVVAPKVIQCAGVCNAPTRGSTRDQKKMYGKRK